MNYTTEQKSALAALAARPFWRKAAGKSFLITGATGLLGSWLTAMLLQISREQNLGCRVTALSRNRGKATAQLEEAPDLELLTWDVCTPLPGERRWDYILHTAGLVGPAWFTTAPYEVMRVHTLGAMALLAHAAAHYCKGFVLASTHEVYGETREELLHEEMAGSLDSMDPRACYPQAKRAAETALACRVRCGLPAVSARLSRLYGENMNLESGLFLCDFLRDALAGRPVWVRGDAALLRPLCHAADAAAAMFYLLFEGVPGEAYNIQGEGALTIGEIAARVGDLSGQGAEYALPETLNRAPHGQVLDCSKIHRLGWQPHIPFDRGLAHLWGSLPPPV